MRTYLTLLIVAALSQACGVAIPKTSSTTGTDTTDTSTTDSTSNTTTQTPASIQTKAAVKVAKTAAAKIVIPEAPVDPLTGTIWQTKCAVQSNGSSYMYQDEFIEGEVTITALSYSDSACQDLLNVSAADVLAYAIKGNFIQVGQNGVAGEWDATGASTFFSIDNGILILSNLTYNQVSQATE